MTNFETLWHGALPYETSWPAARSTGGCGRGSTRSSGCRRGCTRRCRRASRRRLLVIAEDWCGDASSTVPILARFADCVPGMELRVLRRDEHTELMDRYLTNGSRSIPIVIVLDEAFRELGHWGPRPGELQAWVLENRPVVPKAELYPQIRRWYARDRGETTLREVAEIVGRAAA